MDGSSISGVVGFSSRGAAHTFAFFGENASKLGGKGPRRRFIGVLGVGGVTGAGFLGEHEAALEERTPATRPLVYVCGAGLNVGIVKRLGMGALEVGGAGEWHCSKCCRRAAMFLAVSPQIWHCSLTGSRGRLPLGVPGGENCKSTGPA